MLRFTLGFGTKVVTTVQTMVGAAVDGIATHDWHTGNIGFPEDTADRMLLLDWEKNRPAAATESYTERMDNCLHRFAEHLPGPHTYDKEYKTRLRSCPSHSERYIHWENTMTQIAESLRSWWSAWKNNAPGRDQYPTTDDFQKLKTMLISTSLICLNTARTTDLTASPSQSTPIESTLKRRCTGSRYVRQETRPTPDITGTASSSSSPSAVTEPAPKRRYVLAVDRTTSVPASSSDSTTIESTPKRRQIQQEYRDVLPETRPTPDITGTASSSSSLAAVIEPTPERRQAQLDLSLAETATPDTTVAASQFGEETDLPMQQGILTDIQLPQILSSWRNISYGHLERGRTPDELTAAQELDRRIQQDQLLLCQRVGQLFTAGHTKVSLFDLLKASLAPTEDKIVLKDWIEEAWQRHQYDATTGGSQTPDDHGAMKCELRLPAHTIEASPTCTSTPEHWEDTDAHVLTVA